MSELRNEVSQIADTIQTLERVYRIAADPRAKSFYGKYGELFQVELEALNPSVLNDVSEYIDEEQQQRVRNTEGTEVDHIRRRLELPSGVQI